MSKGGPNEGNDQDQLGYRLCQGDEAALHIALHELGPRVLSTLAAQFQPPLNDADLDDVLAVALYRLWVSRAQFDPEKGSLPSWFFRIARNTAIDVLRSRKKRHEMSLEAAPVASLVANAASSDVDSPETHRVRTVLETFSEPEQSILLGHAAGEQVTKEHAAEAKRTTVAMRKQRSRLVQQFRKQFEDRIKHDSEKNP